MAKKGDAVGTAIGFYLTLEDTLTPSLGKAHKSYDAFTKALDAANTLANAHARKGMNAMANAVESFGATLRDVHKQTSGMPKGVADAFKKIGKLKSPHHSIAVDVKLNDVAAQVQAAISTVEMPGLVSGVADAVTKSMTKVMKSLRLTLTAAIPKKRNAAFDVSSPMREQYKNLANPVDYKGKMYIPKFATGGHVGSKLQGSAGPSPVDDVLALLNKDEFVLSADMVKELEKSVGKLRSSSGQFIKFPVDVGDALANISNLEKAVEKLKPVVEAGLDPNAAKDMEVAVAALNAQMTKLTAGMKGLDPKSARKLASEFVKVKNRVTEVNKEFSGTDDKLDKIADASRFTALMSALDHAGSAFSNFSSSASDVFGGDQMEGFVDNMNQVNRQLGFSRDELSQFKNDMIDVASATDGAVNIHEMGEAVEGLVASGMKGKDEIMAMSGAVAMFAKSSGIGVDQAAKMAYGLQRFGLSGEQAIDMLANMNAYTHTLNVNQDELMSSLEDSTKAGASFIASLKPDQVANFSKNTTMLTAALSDNWAGMDGGADAAGGFAKMMAEAASGNPEARSSLQTLGVDFEQMKEALASADPSKMQTLMSSLGATFKTLDTADPATLEAFAKASGITGEALNKLIKNGPDLSASLAKVQDATVKAGEGQKALAKDVENTQTWWQGFKNSIVNGAAAIGGAGLVDFFKEFNPQAALSAIQLGKMTWELLASVPAFVKSGAAAALNLLTFGKFGSIFGGAAKAAGTMGNAAAGAATAVAGPVKSLGTTIAELGQGIGGFISGVAKGLGQAMASIGAGVSAGIIAMLPGLVALGTFFMTPVAWVAVAGIAALGASLIPLAYALNVASPAIAAFGKIIEGTLSGVGKLISEVLGGLGNFVGNVIRPIFESVGKTISDMFKTLIGSIKEIDTGKLLALGPAFAAAGVGMGIMAGGLMAMAPALVAIGAGLTLFSAIAPSSSGTTLASSINDLAASFTVDGSVLEPATKSVWMSVAFLGGLGAAAAAMSAGALAAAPLLLGVSAGMMVLPALVDGIVETMQMFNTKLAVMPALTTGFAPTISAMWELTKVLGAVSGAAAALTAATAVGFGANILNGLMSFFSFGKSPLAVLAEQMDSASVMAQSLVKSTDSLVPLLPKFDGTVKAMSGVAAFTGELSTLVPKIAAVAELSDELSGGVFSSSAWDKINTNLLPALQSMQSLQAASANIFSPNGQVRPQGAPAVTRSMIASSTSTATAKEEDDAAAEIPPYIMETNALLRTLIDATKANAPADAAPTMASRSSSRPARNSGAVSTIAKFG